MLPGWLEYTQEEMEFVIEELAGSVYPLRKVEIVKSKLLRSTGAERA